MVAFKQVAVIAIVLSGLSHTSAEEDIKRILRKAAVQWAYNFGSRINPTALNSGLCFSRNDPSDNRDTCQNQPAGASNNYKGFL